MKGGRRVDVLDSYSASMNAVSLGSKIEKYLAMLSSRDALLIF